ncbi:hypothetical protein BD310DRAFT_834969 [Dichomitus squalens]|uniref:Uncharacterized protein n=1 Tax=Dichomitus squalens TaxID=114155 RepID=A0A4Q9PDS8_9APHY|nr:hypothetical protein BD310DRAFT_834969 [Dichomitus squalens]
MDYGPFANASQFRVVDHFYGRSDTHSLDALDDLISVVHDSGPFSAQDGWHQTSVAIPLPRTYAKYKSEAGAPKFTVPGVVHRHLLALVKLAVQDQNSYLKDVHHWHAHRKFWIPPSSLPSSLPSPGPGPSSSTYNSTASQTTNPSPIRVYTDCYNSNAMLDMEAEIRQRPRVPGDALDMEYVVLPLLLWSDATQLSSFGSAALWPIYLYFGNLSKYFRGRPTEFMAHHLAYIPGLPDALKDFYMATYGKSPSADELKFCKRELFQQIWLLLLDEDFMQAFEHGIVLTCGDGVLRRLFPRFFTYSADYPEKVLIAALRPLARCLCPRCLTPKDKVSEAGTKSDDRRRTHTRQDTTSLREDIHRARKNLFKGYSIAGKHVKSWLDAESLTPIQSAFSVRFAGHGVNFYDMLAPDLMHEFELGVWKGIFTHLMRMLAEKGGGAVEEFNSR